MKIGINSKTQLQKSHNIPKTLKKSWLVLIFLSAYLIIYLLLYIQATKCYTFPNNNIGNSDILTDPTAVQEKSDVANINNPKDSDEKPDNTKAFREDSDADNIINTKETDVNITKTTVSPEESIAANFTKSKDSSKRSVCRPIFYSNGGKMGSTALASLLKHKYPSYTEYDPDGPFDDAGKELCWNEQTVESFQRHFKTNCEPPHQFALDACPKPSTEERMINIKSSFPEAVIIMFMREQGAAALSYFNDIDSSGSKASGDISEGVLKEAFSEFRKYDFVERYKMLRKHFNANKIVVVQTENMRSDEGALAIVTTIAKTAGFSVPRQVKGHRSNNADNGGKRYNKGWITEEASQKIKAFWFHKNKVMEELVDGFRLHSSFYPRINSTDAAISA